MDEKATMNDTATATAERTPPAEAGSLGLFDAYGVELEYMLVDRHTLDVAPVADKLLEAVAGTLTDEYENGEIAWNNELALHVIEFKSNGPRPSLEGLGEAFQENVALAKITLEPDGYTLMPGAMHPWMVPTKVKLWPHGSHEVYAAFDRIFGCQGHGWANLQSTHLNLPFHGDEEFARLHAAIRMVLPLLPGLAASSPAMDGGVNGIADNRLSVYYNNCARVPSVTGQVIPEPVYTMDAYHSELLQRVYDDLAPLDREGVLRHEWVNARGAIARFDRMTIEIRLLDIQECPAVDIAYAGVIVETLKALCDERWGALEDMRAWPTEKLARMLKFAGYSAERAIINDSQYLYLLGMRVASATLGEVWKHLIDAAATHGATNDQDGRILEHYLRHGTLSTRLVQALGDYPSKADFKRVYGNLCEALASGQSFASE